MQEQAMAGSKKRRSKKLASKKQDDKRWNKTLKAGQGTRSKRQDARASNSRKQEAN
jgi:hypothetical protein